MPPNYYRNDFDWKTWTSWNKQASEAVDRSFDYPHVAAAYWVSTGSRATIRDWLPRIPGIGT